MKSGMDRETGKLITGLPYLRQRFFDALNTPLGSLVGRRQYGSRLYEMIDRNVDDTFRMDVYIRVAEAVANPANGLEDYRLSEMTISKTADNHISIFVTGVWLTTGDVQPLEGLILNE